MIRIKHLSVASTALFASFQIVAPLMAETFLMNDDIIRTKIAIHHLNKISVKNDKIVSVSGNDGTYFFEKNEKHGFGFIKPSLENENNPISLNITTASGKTQGLLLDVEDCDPQTIELQSDQKVAAPLTNVFTDIGDYDSELSSDNSSNDYESSIVDAMKLLITGKNLQKLDIEDEPKRNVNCFKIEFLEAYRVGGFIGYKFKIQLEAGHDSRSCAAQAAFGNSTFELQESRFFQKGDVALSFSNLVISKNRPVILYILRRS